MAGRPTKMTPEVIQKVLEALSAGNYREVAADYAGIGLRTLVQWMKEGKDNPGSPAADFRAAVIETEGKAEMRMVAAIVVAAKKDARHAEWYLERKFNKRWGRKDERKVEHAGEIGNKLTHAYDNRTTEELMKVVMAAREGKRKK